LTMIEGTQGTYVGLSPVNPKIYKDSYPIACIDNKVLVKDDNLNRYLLGC